MKIIYYLANETNIGDNATAYAIARKLNENIEQTCEIEKISAAELRELEVDTTRENNIVIGAGVHNLQTLAYSSLKTVWSCHQLPMGYFTEINNIDIVAIPEYAISTEVESNITTKLIKTHGVAHSRELSSLVSDFNQSDIPRKERYRLIVLGGDAPDISGKINYFSKSSVQALANYLKEYQDNDEFTLITNCHRTGKHDQETGEIIDNHQKDSELDAITTEFIKSLSQANEDYLVYDFKHNCKNYYTELLGAVANSDSIIYIPGESTSMISEALSVIPAEKIYIYDTDSMSEAHHKHVKYTADKFPIFHLKLSEAKDHYTRCHTCNSTTDKYDYNASKHIALASKDILEFENEKITPSIRP